MNPAIRGLLDKAQQSTEAAQSLLADNYVDFSASRAYYAMFYALEALLLTKNLSFSKHSAVIAAFGKEYIKSGILDSRFHRAVIDAFDLRNAGDYGTMHAVSAELASQTIQNAKELIHAVSSHIEGLQRPKGFTLVELAVSLVVIGLLIGLGVGMVGPLMTAIKVRESKENLGGAVESVNSWAAGNNRLPDTTSAAASPTLFANATKTPVDSWGRNFLYLYDCRLASTDSATCTGAGTAITKDTICGRRTTHITLKDKNTDATIQNVAYVILSQGDDAIVDSTFGTCLPSETVLAAGPRNVATSICADTSNDLVRWVTLDELRTKIGCQGAQLRIVNNELPYGYNNTSYSANIYADGGVPFASGGKYSWCIQTSLGDIATPSTLTFKTTDGINVPFKASCSNLNVKSDHLVIGGTPVIPAVKGTDSKNYICSQGHIATLANRPVDGVNYSKFWQAAPTGITSSTWVVSTVYFPSSSNSFTVYAYDAAENIASKTFVLTINP